MSFSLHPLRTLAALSLLVVALAHCELLVDLDRGEVDGAVPEGCPICTNLTEGGDLTEGGSPEDGTEGGDLTEGGDGGEIIASGDASVEDAGVDGTGTMTDTGADASLPDGTSENAETDGAGE